MRLTKLIIFIQHSFQLSVAYRLNFVLSYLSVLLTVVFLYFLDKLFSGSQDQALVQYDYFTFVLIGFTFSRLLRGAVQSFSSRLREQLAWGTLDALLVTATSVVSILLGPGIWLLLDALIIIILQLGLGILLGADFSQANWWAALWVILISLSSLLAYGVISAAFTLVYKRSDPVNRGIIAIAYLFSGVFFPIELLPGFMQIVSYLLPFTYALRSLRQSLMQGATMQDIQFDLVVLTGFTLLLLPLAIFVLQAAVQYTRRTGNLSHY